MTCFSRCLPLFATLIATACGDAEPTPSPASTRGGVEVQAMPEIDDLLSRTEAYVVTGDDGLSSFDDAAALADGISEEAVTLRRDLIDLNNQIRASGDVLAVDLPESLLERLEPLFAEQVESSPAESAGIGVAHQSLTRGLCGRGLRLRHRCPPREYSTCRWPTERELRIYLGRHGYRRIPERRSFTRGKEYARCRSAYGCRVGRCYFRSRVVVTRCAVAGWRYWRREPEPNPALQAERWPGAWWGAYVIWWHEYYC